MELKNIVAKNVFRYEKFELNFDNEIYLVLGKIDDNYDGSNGAGKSSIMDIVLYSLYGKTLRKGITDISTNHCGNMSVKLLFDNKKIIRKKTDGDNSVELFIDDKKQKGLKKEFQNFISEEIDFDLFRLITMFTPKNNYFMLNDTEKKDLLISFTNNDYIDKVYDLVKKDLDKLKMFNIDALISSHETSLENKEEIIKEHKKLKNKIDKYDGYEEGISKYHEFLRLRKSLFSDFFDYKEDYIKYQKKGKKLNKVIKDIKEVDLENGLNKINEYQNTVSNNEDKKEELEKRLKSAEKGKCPILKEDCSIISKGIQNYKDDISECNQQIKIVKELLTEEKVAYMELKEEKEANDELLFEKNEVKVKFDNAKKNCWNLKMRVLELYKDFKEYREYKDVDIDIQELKNMQLKFGELKERVNSLNEREEELDKLKKQKEETDAEMNDLEEIKKVFSKDGLKQFIIQKISEFLKDNINEMISKIFDDMIIDIRLDFTEKRNMMNIDIIRDNVVFDIEELSTGERRIVEIIFQIALNDLYEMVSENSINLMIFDETFDALDKNNMHKIADVLSILEKKNKTIFILSHNDNVKKYFNNILVVEKQNNVSKIQEVLA